MWFHYSCSSIDQPSALENHMLFRAEDRSSLSRLKPRGRRSEKAGLEGRKEVCIAVQETCYCQLNACKHTRLRSAQTGARLLISHCTVVAQTGQPHAGDARVTAAYSSRPSKKLWLHRTSPPCKLRLIRGCSQVREHFAWGENWWTPTQMLLQEIHFRYRLIGLSGIGVKTFR